MELGHKWLAEHETWNADFRRWEAFGSKGIAPAKPTAPTVPKANIEAVLGPILIRRRRRDIEESYGDTAVINGKPVQFPVPRLANLEYRLDRASARAGKLDELEGLLQQPGAKRYPTPK